MLQTCTIGDNAFATPEGLMAEAVATKADLANSQIRLFKKDMVVVSETTVLADLDAAEADYTGYTTGGVTVTAFNDPYVDRATGSVVLTSPLTQFNTADVTTVPNDIAGAYLVDAAGKLRGVREFDSFARMANAFDSIPVVFERLFKE